MRSPLNAEAEEFGAVAVPLELTAPAKGEPPKSPWTVVGHNKNVLKAWERLAQNTPRNVINCYDWLRRDPMRPIPGRCYALKGKQNQGCWGYEIGRGDRVYYRPDEAAKKVTVYYAGPHPKRGIPLPPEDTESNNA
jgi:hypothetical protein